MMMLVVEIGREHAPDLIGPSSFNSGASSSSTNFNPIF